MSGIKHNDVICSFIMPPDLRRLNLRRAAKIAITDTAMITGVEPWSASMENRGKEESRSTILRDPIISLLPLQLPFGLSGPVFKSRIAMTPANEA